MGHLVSISKPPEGEMLRQLTWWGFALVKTTSWPWAVAQSQTLQFEILLTYSVSCGRTLKAYHLPATCSLLLCHQSRRIPTEGSANNPFARQPFCFSSWHVCWPLINWNADCHDVTSSRDVRDMTRTLNCPFKVPKTKLPIYKVAQYNTLVSFFLYLYRLVRALAQVLISDGIHVASSKSA